MKILHLLKPAASMTGNLKTTALQAGKILTARVEGFEGGKVRLDIGGGRRVFAETSMNVQIGETVRVRVETPPGLINLKAQSLSDSSAKPAQLDQPIAEALKTLLSGVRNATGLAPQLHELAVELVRLAGRLDTTGISQKNLSPELTEQIQSIAKAIQVFDGRLRAEGLASGLDGAAVKELIENSGLFLEARLAAGRDVSQDLKALLLKLRAALELMQNPGKVVQGRSTAGSSGDIQALAGSLKLATGAEIGDIESKQAMNLMAQESGASTTISVPLTGEFSRSELIISEEKGANKNGKNAPKRYRVTLSLDMSRLGHIRTDAIQSGKSLAIGFAVKDDKTYRLIESHLEKLHAQVRAENLPVGEIFLRKAEPEFEKTSPENSSLLISRKA